MDSTNYKREYYKNKAKYLMLAGGPLIPDSSVPKKDNSTYCCYYNDIDDAIKTVGGCKKVHTDNRNQIKKCIKCLKLKTTYCPSKSDKVLNNKLCNSCPTV